jgi:hypothetical protein
MPTGLGRRPRSTRPSATSWLARARRCSQPSTTRAPSRGGLTGEMLKCQLKPLDFTSYPGRVHSGAAGAARGDVPNRSLRLEQARRRRATTARRLARLRHLPTARRRLVTAAGGQLGERPIGGGRKHPAVFAIRLNVSPPTTRARCRSSVVGQMPAALTRVLSGAMLVTSVTRSVSCRWFCLLRRCRGGSSRALSPDARLR